MTDTLIVNARLVNEGREFDADLRIRDGRIDAIGSGLSARDGETVVGPHPALRAAVLVLQRGAVERRRIGVGHVHHAGQPAGDRGRRLGRHVGLVLEPRLAEVHLVVDHARQQAASVGIDHGLAVARGQAAADGVDAAVADAQVALRLATFVHEAGVDDQRSGRSGHGALPFIRTGEGRDRGRPDAAGGSDRRGAPPASRRAARRSARSPSSRTPSRSARNGSAGPAGG
jgi:hypothetical protein